MSDGPRFTSLPWEVDPANGPRDWTQGVTQAQLDARKAASATDTRAAVALERIADALEELVLAFVVQE